MTIKRINRSNTQLSSSNPEEDYYESIQKYTKLYRILLARPCATNIVIDKWNRIDLELVSELGLRPKGEKEMHCWLELDVELLIQVGKRIAISESLNIQIRPIQHDAWDFNDTSGITGFQYSTLGDFEYAISLKSKSPCLRIKYPNCYLKILPKGKSGQTVQVLPLVVGPISLNNASDLGYGEGKWALDTPKSFHSTDSFHAYCLPDQSFLVIKEKWDLGTPGKIWDSALVLSQMFAEMIQINPKRFDKLRILDLSAGTGCVGLLIAALYKRFYPNYHPEIILTDLQDALYILEYNRAKNFLANNAHVMPLTWGNRKDEQLILKNGPIDFIIASDVLYKPEHFQDLVNTLDQLCSRSSGMTKVYLGYKKRGLSEESEDMFFDLCSKKFHIYLENKKLAEEIGQSAVYQGWTGSSFTSILKETEVNIYQLVKK
ncbi:hypothetical protein K501DRAFT_263220 [Backusella circina FSU 941]|nr:hypothetical protein K501DRAFT_263220 [Backusella circina FSU 941]